MKANEKGLSLLEYAAAAAILIGIVYVGFSAFGTSLSDLFDSMTTWANNRTTQIGNAQ